MPDLETITDMSVLRLSSEVSLQSLGENEGGVLLNLQSGEMYSLNDTAIEFLNRIDGRRTIGTIVSELLDLFEVDRATLLADVNEIAGDLRAAGLVLPA